MPTPEARKSRKRLQWVVTILGLIAAIALVAAGAALKKSRDIGRSSRYELCHEEQRTRAVLHDLIRDARAGTLKQPPSARRDRAAAFFESYIDRLDRLDCGAIIRRGH